MVINEFQYLLDVLLVYVDLGERFGLGLHAYHVVEYLKQGSFPCSFPLRVHLRNHVCDYSCSREDPVYQIALQNHHTTARLGPTGHSFRNLLDLYLLIVYQGAFFLNECEFHTALPFTTSATLKWLLQFSVIPLHDLGFIIA